MEVVIADSVSPLVDLTSHIFLREIDLELVLVSDIHSHGEVGGTHKDLEVVDGSLLVDLIHPFTTYLRPLIVLQSHRFDAVMVIEEEVIDRGFDLLSKGRPSVRGEDYPMSLGDVPGDMTSDIIK